MYEIDFSNTQGWQHPEIAMHKKSWNGQSVLLSRCSVVKEKKKDSA